MKKIIITISIFFIAINSVYAKENVKFSKCVDGDTFKISINNKKQMVRLLAIDAPESVKADTEVEYYGKEASTYICKKLTNAKKIELEYDENSDKYDKYDRLLAWVFVDGKLLQEDLVAKGYVKVAYLYGNYKYTDILKEKQELASANNLGIWNEKAKQEYENNKTEQKEETTDKSTNIEVVVLVILFLIITFLYRIFPKKK